MVDFNECEHGTANCTGRCVNTVGSFVCACQEGFTGDVDNCVGKKNLKTILTILEKVSNFCLYKSKCSILQFIFKSETLLFFIC